MATAIITTMGDGKTVKIVDQWGNKPIYVQLPADEYKKVDEGIKDYEEDEEDYNHDFQDAEEN